MLQEAGAGAQIRAGPLPSECVLRGFPLCGNPRSLELDEHALVSLLTLLSCSLSSAPRPGVVRNHASTWYDTTCARGLKPRQHVVSTTNPTRSSVLVRAQILG